MLARLHHLTIEVSCSLKLNFLAHTLNSVLLELPEEPLILMDSYSKCQKSYLLNLPQKVLLSIASPKHVPLMVYQKLSCTGISSSSLLLNLMTFVLV
ncbi:unnamed protein product [Hymenolepis diminuta]|uniref:Uncharacterized protein n=1 Tax=Hymenolepis diminuta TaxID=6216 RepID=A0A564Y732_HYMDI|nr:unnamed protein product [Hymenolepis diminuta]